MIVIILSPENKEIKLTDTGVKFNQFGRHTLMVISKLKRGLKFTRLRYQITRNLEV